MSYSFSTCSCFKNEEKMCKENNMDIKYYFLTILYRLINELLKYRKNKELVLVLRVWIDCLQYVKK